MLFLSVGYVNAFNIDSTLMLIKTLFGLSYIFLFMLLSLMMIAIIISHYFEYRLESVDEDLDFIKLILRVSIGKFTELPQEKYNKLKG